MSDLKVKRFAPIKPNERTLVGEALIELHKSRIGDKVEVDERTKKWLRERPGIQTTMVQCKKCGLHYKPSLGHKCKNEVAE